MGRTLYDKLWDEHVVHTEEDGTTVLYIDRHLLLTVISVSITSQRENPQTVAISINNNR